MSAAATGPAWGTGDLATTRRRYPQLLRGPGHRWWRCLLSAAVVLGGLLVLVTGSTVALVVAALVGGLDLETLADDLDQPWALLATNLMLAALVPISVLAVWAGHRWRPRWVSSVAGGLRWAWMLRCAGAALLLAVAGTAALWAVGGRPSGTGTDVAVLLTVVAFTTPLQAAGEEYFFRGWMSQAIGALFARPVLAALVPAAVSATAFALAHGGQDAYLFADRFAFGLLASYLAWRTGGLEAGIAAHAVNNIVVFVPTILTGGLGDALGVSSADGPTVAVDIASLALLGAVLTWLARHDRVQDEFLAPAPAVGQWFVPPDGSGSIPAR